LDKFIDAKIKPDSAKHQKFSVFDSQKNIADFILSDAYDFTDEFIQLLSLIYDVDYDDLGLDSVYSDKTSFIEDMRNGASKIKDPNNAHILGGLAESLY
jgi:hypothetical protein